MKRLSPLLPLLIAGTLAGPVHAETGYVTDSCTIPIRRGTSTQYKILFMAPSGTPLQILEINSTEGYTKVKTPEGTVGWILTRYLMEQPAPRDQVTQLEARITWKGFRKQAHLNLTSFLYLFFEVRVEIAQRVQMGRHVLAALGDGLDELYPRSADERAWIDAGRLLVAVRKPPVTVIFVGLPEPVRAELRPIGKRFGGKLAPMARQACGRGLLAPVRASDTVISPPARHSHRPNLPPRVLEKPVSPRSINVWLSLT